MPADAPVLAALSLGGNVGDVIGAFRHALARLAATPGVELVATSSVWRTKAWGRTDQPDFLNMCVLARASLSPRDLLALCLAIESERGRERAERWGPRTLDIDVLTYGDLALDEPGLTLPHPRLFERAFVLAPLAEIAGDLRIGGEAVGDLAARVDMAGVAVDSAASQSLAISPRPARP